METIASGWGATSFGAAISNTLQYVKVTPVSDDTCNQPGVYDGSINSETMICAGTNFISHQKISSVF